MQKRAWARRVKRLLRHDLTLAALVVALLAVSAGVIAAARRESAPLAAAPSDALSVGIEAALADAREHAAQLDPRLPAVAEPDPVCGPAPPEPALAEPLVALAAHEAAALPTAAVAPAFAHFEGSLRRGESLARSMGREGVEIRTVNRIAGELRGLYDFRRARPGHAWSLELDAEGEIESFRYTASDIESYALRREGSELVARKDAAELRPHVSRIAGVVSSSLHEALIALGEYGQLANDFAEIFAWDVDFSRTVHRGDEFGILYERLYRDDPVEGEVYVRPGRILAARYQGAAGNFSAVYFEQEQGRGGYYRPDGTSVQGLFLQAPLSYSRISSRFTNSRRHPILNITRPHHGIDYAAPHGTPIWAVADGQVIYRGWAGGFGNLVKVRHRNGYISYYAHLSRFARGLAVGRSVQQKQVIGYVGQTGLATGPHVCFRVAKDGRFVDPSRIHLPSGSPVPAERLALFEQARDLLFAGLEGAPLLEVEEAL
jgi:murein DD-endopeptidase MepM/ murein hydrolase activator NlpD